MPNLIVNIASNQRQAVRVTTKDQNGHLDLASVVQILGGSSVCTVVPHPTDNRLFYVQGTPAAPNGGFGQKSFQANGKVATADVTVGPPVDQSEITITLEGGPEAIP